MTQHLQWRTSDLITSFGSHFQKQQSDHRILIQSKEKITFTKAIIMYNSLKLRYYTPDQSINSDYNVYWSTYWLAWSFRNVSFLWQALQTVKVEQLKDWVEFSTASLKRVRVQRVTSRSWWVLLNFFGLLINDNQTAQNKKGCSFLKSPSPLFDMLVWSWAWHSAKATSLTISGSWYFPAFQTHQ